MILLKYDLNHPSTQNFQLASHLTLNLNAEILVMALKALYGPVPLPPAPTLANFAPATLAVARACQVEARLGPLLLMFPLSEMFFAQMLLWLTPLTSSNHYSNASFLVNSSQASLSKMVILIALDTSYFLSLLYFSP